MDGARLRSWDAIERRRRGGFPVGWLVVIVALGAGMWALRLWGGLAEALGWWVVLAAAAGTGLVMTGAWRLYWRPDAPLLARLPIAGGALYQLAVARSLRVGGWVLLALLAGAAPLCWDGGARAIGLLGGIAGFAVVVGCLLEPVASTVAGAMVASDKAQKTLSSMAGEMAGAPATIWLSVIPAMVGFAVGAATWWLASESGRHGLASVGAVGGAIVAAAAVAFAAGAGLAKRWMPAALREVAALDRVQLAHVEKTTARGLEAAWGAVAGAARAVYRKDVALSRRRYPAFYFVTGALIIAAWLAALFGEPATRSRWAVIAAAGIAIYTAIFARRLVRPPVEYPRLVRTLPSPRGGAARAKRAYAVWRAIVPLVWAVTPAIVRHADPPRLLAVCAGIAIVGAAISAFFAGRVDD